MAELDYIENGLRKRKRRRRNPATVAKRATTRAKNPARRSTTKASAAAFAKRNGLKLVSRSVQNPKRKRKHRRNGIAAVSRQRNGIFGNTKGDVKQVLALGGGLFGTKEGAKIIGNLAAPFLSSMNLGGYTPIIIEGVLALVVIPMIVGKIGGRSGDIAKMARLGGLAAVALSITDKFLPGVLPSIGAFNSPVVIANSQAVVAPAAVAQLVNSTSATPSEKAKVAGAMARLGSGLVPNQGMRMSRGVGSMIPNPVFE